MDTVRAETLRARAALLHEVRAFFCAQGFVEVETASMVPSPGLDLHLDAFEVRGGRAPRWLITSPEYQMKRLLGDELPRIFQLCRCFRRNELGTHHEPEFTMLEWYRAHAGSVEVMRDTEEMVAHVAWSLHGAPIIERDGRIIDCTPPWPRLTVREAFKQFADTEMDAVLHDEEKFFLTLIEKIEPELGRTKPTFLVDWPSSMASLARLRPEDPSVADRFEAYIDGIEICNGFGELVDPVEQRDRLERDQKKRAERGLPVYPIDERFIAALECGIPPSGGNALGVDRLVMLVLGAKSVADVVAIPSEEL